jgi:hypothetical protein
VPAARATSWGKIQKCRGVASAASKTGKEQEVRKRKVKEQRNRGESKGGRKKARRREGKMKELPGGRKGTRSERGEGNTEKGK